MYVNMWLRMLNLEIYYTLIEILNYISQPWKSFISSGIIRIMWKKETDYTSFGIDEIFIKKLLPLKFTRRIRMTGHKYKILSVRYQHT